MPPPRTSGLTQTALDVGDPPGSALEGAAADRAALGDRQEERAVRRGHLVGVGREDGGAVQALLEAHRDLGEVLLEAPLRVGRGGVGGDDVRGGGGEQAVDLAHRVDQSGGAIRVQTCRQVLREVVGLPFQRGVRTAPGGVSAAQRTRPSPGARPQATRPWAVSDFSSREV